ncbi:winged helix-turn-helix transcriptional regulator [Micromonospora wenchangensis]|uniref:Transcriptional regulator n=1 Tax=Micromonospora wenchangensis TaxID=1185415 RepID=A0A246R8T8_9ACTN|nr:helix-turn-helix domain-containing protein [Micromonospora wenchangensis]OWU97149.1 transcriptional regulator [Micromonospora wenchangensis]
MSPTHTDVRSLVGAALETPVPADEYDRCPVTEVMRLMSDKWTVIVLVLLGRQPYRFNELHRAIDGISQRMLTRTLRGLESAGLVLREVHPTVPPSVEYRLTPLGQSLLGPLSGLADWAVTNEAALAAGRHPVAAATSSGPH